MIEEFPSQGLACRFTHELVRRALYDRLSGPRRAELHLRVGEALEGAEERSGRALAGLAHHFAAAAPFGDSERAVGYNVRAARSATAALAFDQAAALLRTALALGVEHARRSAWRSSWSWGTSAIAAASRVDALEAFTAAAGVAREHRRRRGTRAGRDRLRERVLAPGDRRQGAVELLEEAAAALGEEDSELRVGLLGGLARALDFQGRRTAAPRRCGRPRSTMARRLGDSRGWPACWCSSYWSRGTTPLEEILDMLTEARDIGTELGDTEIRADAMSWRVPAFVALCDHASARPEVGRAAGDRRADSAAVHRPRRRALRVGHRAVRRRACRRPRLAPAAPTSGAGC